MKKVKLPAGLSGNAATLLKPDIYVTLLKPEIYVTHEDEGGDSTGFLALHDSPESAVASQNPEGTYVATYKLVKVERLKIERRLVKA